MEKEDLLEKIEVCMSLLRQNTDRKITIISDKKQENNNENLSVLCYSSLLEELYRRLDDLDYSLNIEKEYKDLHKLKMLDCEGVQTTFRPLNIIFGVLGLCIALCFIKTSVALFFVILALSLHIVSFGTYSSNSYELFLRFYIETVNKTLDTDLLNYVEVNLDDKDYSLADKISYTYFYYVIKTCSVNTLFKIINRGGTLFYKDLCPEERVIL